MATVGEKMTAIANAIRTKTGGTGKLTLDTMASSLNNIPERTSSNLSADGATVTVPAGNYKSQATKSVATVTRANTTISTTADDTNDKLTITASNNQGTGYVTGANKTATATITLTASGATVTASDGTNKVSKSVATATQATPSISVNSSGLITASATQDEGYVSAGTKSATKQLTTKAAATITPTTSEQTAVAKNVYTTGIIKVAAMPTATQAAPSISVSSSGLITASATQDEGYVTAGTKSTTKQLTTKAAATITPGTSNQTIAAGTYLTGTQTIAGDADLVSTNIIKGATIFGVAGSYEGLELNFDVKRYSSEELLMADAPIENTIGVVTTTPIINWDFSTTEPTECVNGDVWFVIGEYGDLKFNALKKNSIYVHPMFTKQYISGAYVDVISMVYQCGKWHFLVEELYLYDNGVFIDDTELKIASVVYGSASGGTCIITNEESSVTIGSYGGQSALVYFPQKYNLTSFDTLYFNGTFVNRQYGGRCGFGVWKSIPTGNAATEASAILEGFIPEDIHALDISSCTGEYYVGIAIFGFGTGTYPYTYAMMKQMYLK